MPVQRYRYFSPQDAARMGKLELFAREVVEGVITGMHKSPHRGFSAEFSEHREYVPGDELRHLDWKVVGRTDRYYIKLFEQETNLRATLVVDNSASMRFGNKLEYSRHMAACLAYLLAMQQDLAGLCAVDESIRVELPPASSPAHVDRLFRELEKLAAGTTTLLPQHLHSLAERMARRGLVILISDLWVDTGELLRALQHLRYRKHQAILIHLQDESELTLTGPAFAGQITLQDMETSEKLPVEPAGIREAYKRLVADHIDQIRRGCMDCGSEYHAIDIRQPYDKTLVELLSRRR
jgi:uncharacterized protein (DUF58 family)